MFLNSFFKLVVIVVMDLYISDCLEFLNNINRLGKIVFMVNMD